MTTKAKDNNANSLLLDGVLFKTSGNIVFNDPDESPYYLAEGSHLEKIEGMLEHGMQMLLKKIKS